MVKVVFALETSNIETYQGHCVMLIKSNIGKYSQEIINCRCMVGDINKQTKEGRVIIEQQ